MLKYSSSTILAFAHRQPLLQLLNSTMFEERLRLLMLQKSVTPTALAERTGIALSHISQLRHGKRKPSRKTLERISQGLGVTVDELLSAKSPTAPKEYPKSEFDKELLLFREEVKKYGVEGVRTARALLPVIFKKTSLKKKVSG